MLTRRTLMETAGGAMLAALATTPARVAAAGTGAAPDDAARKKGTPSFVIFSKHLPELNWGDLASAAIDMGFDGIDLTVRSKGHVAPERAAEDLPRAVDAIRAKGTKVAMITTELTSARHPTARPILEAAGKAGVRLVKPGYWKYDLKDVRAEAASMMRDVDGLGALAREHGVEIGVHNHSGNIGGGVFDIAPHMDALDAKTIGYYFDPRHAVVEGGGIGWKAATRLVAPRLKMIAVKDFFWERTPKGWAIKNVPMGEGQVEWPWFANAIVQAGYSGPISLHLEYEIGGATPAEVLRNTIAAATKDLAFTKKQFAEVKA
jgi:L-ribulose-5-phosphate 3-epimerase